MKIKGIIGALTLLVAVVVSSCSTSNDVVSNRKIQKRKYTKGFHVSDKNMSASVKKNKENKTDTFKSEEKFNEVENISATIDKVNTEVENIEETTVNTIQAAEVELVNEIENIAIVNTEVENDEVLTEKGEENITIDIKDNSKKLIKKSQTNSSSPAESGGMLILLIILALILPPVAIAIYQGLTTWFWIDLLLILLFAGGWFLLGGLSSIAGLAAVIIAFLVIFDVI